MKADVFDSFLCLGLGLGNQKNLPKGMKVRPWGLTLAWWGWPSWCLGLCPWGRASGPLSLLLPPQDSWDCSEVSGSQHALRY